MSDFLNPSNLDDALRLRAAHPEYEVIAGGTDLLVASKDRPAPKGTINLFGLPELVGISWEEDSLRIGAATTYSQILQDSEIAGNFPILREAAREVGAAQIHNRGTIGGNIATSSPVGDTLPVWLSLDAKIELQSQDGGLREIPYADFLTGYRQTALKKDELIISMLLPRPAEGMVQEWRKVGTRRAQSISKVMFAGCALVSSGKLSRVRFALGAVADRTIRVSDAEKVCEGQEASHELAEEVAAVVRTAIKPIDDLRSTADYRREIAANMIARFIRNRLE